MNVKPPTLHNPGVAGPGKGVAGVPELKIHGDAIVALVPRAIPEKSPVASVTVEKPALPNTLYHVVTFVAVARDLVLYDTEPPKSSSPVIVVIVAAWACCVTNNAQLKPVVSNAKIVFFKVTFFSIERPFCFNCLWR